VVTATVDAMENIKVRGIAEVIATLPYQLGYRPTGSLVLIGLRRGSVGVVQRLDLPSAAACPTIEEASRALLDCARAMARAEATGAVVLAFEEHDGQGLTFVAAAAAVLQHAGLELVDTVVVRGSRWWSVPATDPAPPPGDPGSPVPSPEDVPAVAALVLRGHGALADRAAVRDLVAPSGGRAADRTEALLADFTDRAPDGPSRVPTDAHVSALTRVLAAGEARSEPAPVDVARLSWSVLDRSWRDGIIAALNPGSLVLQVLPRRVVNRVTTLVLPGSEDTRLVAWLAACRLLPDSGGQAVASMLTIGAHLAWWTGDGALAGDAVDRALRVDPGHTLAGLLARMCEHGIPPRTLALPA
jgi:hypothetical protein